MQNTKTFYTKEHFKKSCEIMKKQGVLDGSKNSERKTGYNKSMQYYYNKGYMIGLYKWLESKK